MRKAYLVLARALAQESVFRANRRNIRVPFVSRDYRGISALSSNLLPSMFFLLFSSVYLLMVVWSPLEVLPYILLPLLFMVAYFNIVQMLSFSSIFFGDELFESVRILPLSSKDLVKIYFLTYILYWGGASTTMLFLPQFVTGVVFRSEALPCMLSFLFSSASVMFSSILLAVYIGSYTQVFRKSILMNVLSALGWLILLSAYYLLFSTPALANLSEILPAEYTRYISLIPFAGPLYVGIYPLESLVSIAATGVLVYLIYHKATASMEAVVSGTRISRTPFLARRPGGDKIGYRRLSKQLSLVVKDFKLILREPRRLSGMLYLMLFPILFIGFGLAEAHTMFTFYLLMGSIVGLSSTTWVYLEGEGARVLYYLPLKRTEIYVSKVIDGLTVAFSVLAFLMLAKISGFAGISLYGAIAMISASIFTTTTSLAFIIANVPEQPSSWTESSVNRSKIVLLQFVIASVSVAIPLALSLVYGILVATLAASVLCAIGSLGSLLYVREKR